MLNGSQATSDAHVERLYFLQDFARFRAMARDLRASRGTQAFWHDHRAMMLAAVLDKSEVFREMCVRYLTRMRCSAAEMQPPKDYAQLCVQASRSARG